MGRGRDPRLGAYVNFAGSATEADLAAIYPPATRQRLAAVKGAYDPGNVFRRNHNIRPGHSRMRRWRRVADTGTRA